MAEKFSHKKSLGQHFLTSDYIPKKMCDAAKLTSYDTVLEIGPGTGILTREILARGARVVAVEADDRAVAALQDSFPEAISSGQLIIHHDDARTLDPTKYNLENQSYIVVSNIPYYLSGHLFRTLLETDCQPTTLVFLIQKEVAERIARDEKESLLSLSVKVFGDPTYICTVKRGHFNPPPKVDSAIVAISNISKNNFSEIDPEFFFKILHQGFGQKRKQLLGNLAQTYDRAHLEEVFMEILLSSTVRAEDVSLDTWLKLVTKLKM